MRQTFFCIAVLISTLVLAQDPNPPVPEKRTRIKSSSMSDTIPFHLEADGCGYDFEKNALPYFTISKSTPAHEQAIASLIVKQVSLVEDKHAAVIKKFFSRWLEAEFQTIPHHSIARGTNLNIHQVIPFRLNKNGQVEELLSYDVNWTVTARNPQASARPASTFTNNSVLAQGTWYKIAVPSQGIYRINRSFLSNMGLNPSQVDPRNIRLFGNGGKMVPELNSAPRTDDLVENAIKVIGEDDGSFDQNDYVLFYATGTDEWKKNNSQNGGLKYSVTKNIYSDTSYYFLTVDQGRGKRISAVSGAGNANVSTSTYDFYNYHEQNVVNFGKTGRQFYGEYFDITTAYNFTWDDGNFVTGDSLITQVTLVAVATQTSEFQVSGNGQNFKVSTDQIYPSQYADYAKEGSGTATTFNNNSNILEVRISKLTAKSLGWLDKVTVNCRRQISLAAKQFNFRDSRVSAPGNICRYTMNIPLNAQPVIWNVTDPSSPSEQQYEATASSLSFVAGASQLQEYCVSPQNNFLTPVFAGRVAKQNLHSVANAQYLIITHPLFLSEAKRLALYHQKQDGLSYYIATIDQVYNEFSSGQQDPAAIRDFIRMIYTRNGGATAANPLYVVLFGDGSYNNMNRNLVNNSNFIPTYESWNSLSPLSSTATDDFFGMMDDNEGFLAELQGKPDVALGRLTVKSLSEAKGVVDKIEHYTSTDPSLMQNVSTDPANCNSLNESTMGDWRNWLLFLGDDQDGALHMIQSNQLTQTVSSIDDNYNFDKIFLDSYQRFSTPGGARYPDASVDFVRRMKKGALIFNYTGHGGEVGLTAERMVDLDIINNLDNFNRLPLFITATCEFSRYDDPSRTSAGELCLLNPKGGAIALFTTCRVAFADKNFTLNLVILQKLFTRLPNGKMPTLGEAIELAKNDPLTSSITAYYTNFHLLGDPALRLNYPQENVVTTSINNRAVSATSSDTLGALAKVTIKGFVADRLGNKLSNFNGLVYPTVFDKEQQVTCLINTPESSLSTEALTPFVFKLQKNILYRGKASVVNGEFSFTFLVPKDISFAIGPGKISYYATNGNIDAQGVFRNVQVGGAALNTLPDNAGPQIHLYLNDKNFISGGVTNEKPVLYADLVDSSGINTLGTGIGHDIAAVLDGNSSKPLILNDYYEAALNSYQSGRVRYPYSKLEEGQHQLSFKVWDIQNNSSLTTLDFVVAPSAELALKHVLNYPNPFTTHTKFFFEHNQACNPLKVNIEIYTVTGKLVKTLQETVMCEGYRPEGIDWDGRDDFGDRLGRGVYVYRLSILNVENKKAEKIEKLVILN